MMEVLRREIAATEIRRVLIKLLARREYSKHELRRKLATQVESQSLLTAAIDRLANENLQSDKRFSGQFVSHRINKGYGPIRIGAELRERGIAEQLIQVSLEPYKEQWVPYASKARIKRFGSSLPVETAEKMKQMRFLQYRGFSSEHIKKAICD